MIHISNIVKYLEKVFPGKLLLYFQDFSCQGFEYPIDNRFLASNILPEAYQELQSLNDDMCEYRIFCHLQETIATHSQIEFFQHLDKKTNAPRFFMTPYFAASQEEVSYIISPGFEIKIKLQNSKIDISYLNYSQENKDVITLFEKIKIILQDIIEKDEQKNIINLAGSIKPSLNLNDICIKHDFDSIKNHLRNAIKNTKEHMNIGDCYLANITTTLTLSKEKKFITIDEFMAAWMLIKPRFGVYYQDSVKGLACFSPERFLASKNRYILAEPIKGTKKVTELFPSIKDAQALWDNKKEIYENTLVTDLLRHDLNAICQPGSVFVYRPFYTRFSSGLMQMQSSILGRLKETETLASCLMKTLPAGSITGTPKKKVCEIIAAQEKSSRGYYTGIAGILETNGDFDSTLLIRSIYMGARGVYVGVGAGITTLSDVEGELEEFEVKLDSFLSYLVLTKRTSPNFC